MICYKRKKMGESHKDSPMVGVLLKDLKKSSKINGLQAAGKRFYPLNRPVRVERRDVLLLWLHFLHSRYSAQNGDLSGWLCGS